MKGKQGIEPALICVRQKFLLDPHALPTELLSWTNKALFFLNSFQKVIKEAKGLSKNLEVPKLIWPSVNSFGVFHNKNSSIFKNAFKQQVIDPSFEV